MKLKENATTVQYLVLLVIPVILFACNREKDSKENLPVNKIIKVSVHEVAFSDGSHELAYSGTIEPYRTIPLTFENLGTVKSIYVEEGDFVKAGTLLASLDNKDAKNMHRIALSKYQQAKDAYDRLKTVYDQGSLTEIKWVEMETNLDQARSSLEIAENNLAKCNLNAPTDGFIGKRNIEPGQASINALNAPFELVKIEKVFVKIPVPENEINKIKTGQKVAVTVTALGGEPFEGTISRISPVAEMISRTYPVKILVSNSQFKLKPGMVCDVRVALNNTGVKVLIPDNSVTIDNNGKPYVFLLSADRKSVLKRFVTVGNYLGNGIEVPDGLKPGDIIVTEGKEKLSDNSLITF